MSFQYYTKSPAELVESARIIVNNLGEMVGCRKNKKGWTPATGYGVSSALEIAGTNCSNLSDYDFPSLKNDYQYFRFRTNLNSLAASLYRGAKNYDLGVYDLDSLKCLPLSPSLSTLEKLKVAAGTPSTYNSTLFEAVNIDEEMKYTEDYKRVAWIVLAGFSVRWALYDYSVGKAETVNTEILNSVFLDRIKENVTCEKILLESYVGKSSCYESCPDGISEQLSKMLLNIKQLQSFVLRYLK